MVTFTAKINSNGYRIEPYNALAPKAFERVVPRAAGVIKEKPLSEEEQHEAYVSFLRLRLSPMKQTESKNKTETENQTDSAKQSDPENKTQTEGQKEENEKDREERENELIRFCCDFGLLFSELEGVEQDLFSYWDFQDQIKKLRDRLFEFKRTGKIPRTSVPFETDSGRWDWFEVNDFPEVISTDAKLSFNLTTNRFETTLEFKALWQLILYQLQQEFIGVTKLKKCSFERCDHIMKIGPTGKNPSSKAQKKSEKESVWHPDRIYSHKEGLSFCCDTCRTGHHNLTNPKRGKENGKSQRTARRGSTIETADRETQR